VRRVVNIRLRSQLAGLELFIFKTQGVVRHIPVSLPYIGRKECGDRVATILKRDGATESPNESSVIPLARCGTRDGAGVFERYRGARWPHRLKGLDHKNCSSIGKPERCVLAVRAPIRAHRETSVSAVDTYGTAEAPRSDRILLAARDHSITSQVADFRPLDVAPPGGNRSHGARLVYQIYPCGSAAYSRR